jgi:4-diphosphocytidyl-2-C-methyl-D-erythritol kinase
MRSLTLAANAKLNLSLDIAGKREDGYHNIVSEMQEIDLADIVTVRISDSPHVAAKIRIICDDPRIPDGRRNIANRAAEAFVRETGLHLVAKVQIEKKIPLMAGLGGSSTDGAAVLKALNRLNGDLLSESELVRIGAGLGADVPFAIVGGRAKAEGIGEILTKLEDLPEQFYVIVQPDFYCDTRQAYTLYSENPVSRGDYANVFQKLYADPRIERICSELLNLGASAASMTGSGSAVFGVFGDSAAAKSALESLQYPFKCVARNVRSQQGGS